MTINIRKLKILTLVSIWTVSSIYAVPIIKKDYAKARKVSTGHLQQATSNKFSACLRENGINKSAEWKVRMACSKEVENECRKTRCYDRDSAKGSCFHRSFESCVHIYRNPRISYELKYRRPMEVYLDGNYSTSIRLYLMVLIVSALIISFGPLLAKSVWRWLND